MSHASVDTAPSDLRLSDAERAAWERDGFFARECAFDRDELVDLRAAAEAVVERAMDAMKAPEDDYTIDGNRYVEVAGATLQLEHRPGSETLRVIEPFCQMDDRFDTLLDDPRLVEPMKGLVKAPGVAIWTDKLNLKRPREGSPFRFHQDSPYWTHACPHVDQLPNVMLTLDDQTVENGCFRVVRGSHRRGCLPGRRDAGVLGPLFTDPAHFDASAQVATEMPAGSLLFFSPHTVHGSEPNRSERPRRAMVLTYQPAGHPMFKRDGVRNAGVSA